MPRRDLERQGLAVLGQAVSLQCEALPAGGTLLWAAPAVALERPEAEARHSPWEIESQPDEGAIAAELIDSKDQEWIDRGLAHERVAVALAPLPRR